MVVLTHLILSEEKQEATLKYRKYRQILWLSCPILIPRKIKKFCDGFFHTKNSPLCGDRRRLGGTLTHCRKCRVLGIGDGVLHSLLGRVLTRVGFRADLVNCCNRNYSFLKTHNIPKEE